MSRIAAIFAVALALSLGWGIRGNFGHEYGAMIPGALAAMAAVLLSGRADWQRRFPFVACFGALGWGFGGSMAYGHVIAYSHSGHLPTQVYGFACLFLIGFLWAALGGAGTAFPLAADLQRVKELFRPLLWILSFWLILDLVEPLLEAGLEGAEGARRHESPLYWFDADWLPALTALLALCLFDLWDRRFAKAPQLLFYAAGGALAGFALQQIFDAAGLSSWIAGLLVRYEGDLAVAKKEELLINWPQFLPQISRHLGWLLGLGAGAGVYFCRHGQFRSGASLLLHMSLGWWIGFLLFPVLLGARMTPPRGDSWAGILGVFAGAAWHFHRRGLKPVLFASWMSGILGGLGFSGAAWLKLLLVAPGNPNLTSDPAALQAWAHWQGANWHSFLEQSYGLVNGFGIALALGLLARREKPLEDGAASRPGWQEVFSTGFILLALPYVNLVKNVQQWTGAHAVPETMKAPLFESVAFSSQTWFNLLFAFLALGVVALLALHLRRPLAVVPATWQGKGQLVFVLFLWCMVIGNFERALAGFNEQRLLTEGVVFANAVMVMFLVISLPVFLKAPSPAAPPAALAWRGVALGLAALVLAVGFQTASVRAIYGDRHAGHSGKHIRFGPEATWKLQPLRKGRDHL